MGRKQFKTKRDNHYGLFKVQYRLKKLLLCGDFYLAFGKEILLKVTEDYRIKAKAGERAR